MMISAIRLGFFSMAVALVGAIPGTLPAQQIDSYHSSQFVLPTVPETLLPADLNGDGFCELVTSDAKGVTIFVGAATGYSAESKVQLSTSPLLAWTVSGWSRASDVATAGVVADLHLITVESDGRVATWQLREGSLERQQQLTQFAEITLPSGCYHLDFVRDIDNDGDLDLLLPGRGVATPSSSPHAHEGFQLFLNGDEGLERGPFVHSTFEVRQEFGDRLEENFTQSRVGQGVVIPNLELIDLNGDGAVDIRSQTDDFLQVFLSSAGSFPPTPSYAFNLAEARDALGPVHGDSVDLNDITAALSHTVQITQSDVDGDNIQDLVFRSKRTVDLYRATAEGLDTSKPQQRLKASGNVLFVALDDENGDLRNDLWMFRVESLSLSKVIGWLFLPGTITFDALVYEFQGERFSKRPTRHIELALKLPPLMSLMGDGGRSLQAMFEGSFELPTPIDLSGSGVLRDRVQRVGKEVRGYLGIGAPRENTAGGLLANLFPNYSREQDRYQVSLEEIPELAERFLRTLGEDTNSLFTPQRQPDFSWKIELDGDDFSIHAHDLDGDSRQDLLVIPAGDPNPHRKRGSLPLQFFLSRARTD